MSVPPVHSLLLTTFAWVWKTSLATVVLIGLVLLVQFVFQKFLPPRWRYALWLLVLLRMLMPAVPASRVSVFNLGDALPLPSHPQAPAFAAFPGAEARSEEPALPLHSAGGDALVAAGESWPDRGSSSARSARDNGAGSARSSTGGAANLLAAAPMLWLLGATGYLLAVLAQHQRLSSWLKDQQPVVSSRVTSIIDETKATLGLRQEVRVFATDSLRAPSLFGFHRPRLLLSKAMLEQLSDQEMRLVILHELVHVQRRDVLLNWLLILLQALHWFNPFVWLALRRLRSDRELVCDAAVMRHLAADERHAYGTLLIKMLDSFSQAQPAPSLVPILNHKHDIHRRIIMIAHFKPTARLVTFTSALLVVTLGCFTFTAGAEKSSPKPAEKSKPDADLEKQREAQQRGMKVLEEELAKQEERVKQKQAAVDALKAKLSIPDLEDSGQVRSGGEPDSLRLLDHRRIEMHAEYARTSSLLTYLMGLNRKELGSTILTAAPDNAMAELLGHRATMEQKLAELTETYGPENPEVKRTVKVLAIMNQQVDDRLVGILAGLKARAAAEKARLDDLDAGVEKAKKVDISSAIQRRPYFQAKRDLETLQFIREKLAMRIMQERIDAAIPKQP